MTRENKLALVVGFGLILLVGILISDHFSAAQTQEPAELTHAVDRLDRTRWANPDLIAYRSGQTTAAETAVALPPPAPEPAPVVERIEDPLWTAPASAPIDTSEDPDGVLVHVVGPGDSLTSICRNVLGDPTLVTELAALNDLTDPNKLVVGQRLRLPVALVVPSALPAADEYADAQDGDDREVSPGTYTVRNGDSLMTIAQRVLGTVRAFDEIFEANRDQLDTPDQLRPGMVLRIPMPDERPS